MTLEAYSRALNSTPPSYQVLENTLAPQRPLLALGRLMLGWQAAGWGKRN